MAIKTVFLKYPRSSAVLLYVVSSLFALKLSALKI